MRRKQIQTLLTALVGVGVFSVSCSKRSAPVIKNIVDEADSHVLHGFTDSSLTDRKAPQTVVPPVSSPWGVKQVFCERRSQTPARNQSPCQSLDGPGQGLILVGRILTPDVIYENGAVVINREGLISNVGCDYNVQQAKKILICEEQIISPGLINAHDHLAWTNEAPGHWGDVRYDHRHDWRIGTRGGHKIDTSKKIKNVLMAWGELRQLMHGTTSIAGSSKAEGFLRNIDVLDETQPLEPLQKTSDVDMRIYPGLINEAFPLGDNKGHLQSESCQFPFLFNVDSLRKSSPALMLHVAEGVDVFARNEFICLSGGRLGAEDIIDHKTVLVHAIALTSKDAAQIKRRGASVVWSPRSNISLYGQTAPVSLYRHLGVPMAIGTDWMPSGSSTLNREMSCAYDYSQHYLQTLFTPRDIWLMTTGQAASVFGKADAIGYLKKGTLADISIFAASTDASQDPFLQIIESKAQSVLAVFKNGRFIYGSQSLAEDLAGEFANGPCEELPVVVCGERQSLCGALETKIPLAQLFAQHEKAYPLFSCNKEPSDEPSCQPQRPGEYTGRKTALDQDGDGVPNQQDNCPLFFNPKRPVDGFMQTDSDGDGLGDECDVCPLDAKNQCTSAASIDSDGDKIADQFDNCPLVANSDQSDTDIDGIGDGCDACSDIANPDGICPATISEVNNQRYPAGTKVRIHGQAAFVEAELSGNTKKRSLYLAAVDDNQQISAFNGLFVYKARGQYKSGDELDIIGVVNPYWGQMQILPLRTDVLPVDVGASEKLAIEATPIQLLDLPFGDDLTELERRRWESRLVSLDALSANTDEAGNIILDGKIVLDKNFANLTLEDLCDGSNYQVTGFLSLRDAVWTIRPRDLNDVVRVSEACLKAR